MKLTLKSLSNEMTASFVEVNDRIDRFATRLDNHICDTNLRFREINERFDSVDQRFDSVDQHFKETDQRFANLRRDIIQDLVEALTPHIIAVEEMLGNHERRLGALEQKVEGNAV